MSRQPLGEISGNSNYRGGTEGRFELTPYWRSHIVSRAAAGQSSKGIATNLNIPSATVQSTVSRADYHYKNESLHQSDCPNIVSEHLCCHLLREVRANPKIRYRELRLNLDLHRKVISKSSLYHILKKEDILLLLLLFFN